MRYRGLDSPGLRWYTVLGSFESDNEHFGPIKAREFLDKLSNYQLLQNNSPQTGGSTVRNQDPRDYKLILVRNTVISTKTSYSRLSEEPSHVCSINHAASLSFYLRCDVLSSPQPRAAIYLEISTFIFVIRSVWPLYQLVYTTGKVKFIAIVHEIINCHQTSVLY